MDFRNQEAPLIRSMPMMRINPAFLNQIQSVPPLGHAQPYQPSHISSSKGSWSTGDPVLDALAESNQAPGSAIGDVLSEQSLAYRPAQ